MKYLPTIVIDELMDIRRENNVYEDSEAMKQLVKYARIGREAERIIKLDWSKAQKRKSIQEFFK